MLFVDFRWIRTQVGRLSVGQRVQRKKIFTDEILRLIEENRTLSFEEQTMEVLFYFVGLDSNRGFQSQKSIFVWPHAVPHAVGR